MKRVFRHALLASLIGLHLAVTLGGAGLHALPGFGHGSGLRPVSKNDHSHGPGKSSHAEADDCPVCQLLAQGQLPSRATTGPTAWHVSDLAPTVVPGPDSPSPLRLPIPRAPPSLASV